MLRSSDESAQAGWLGGCLGFVVDADARRIGRVADVQHDEGSGRPVAIVVRSGLAGRRILRVPIEDVAGVLPTRNRIILNGSWPPSLPADQPAPGAANRP